jgi:hypothetical protein
MSLWSYESQILLLLVFPVALLVHRRVGWRRLGVVFASWYAVPAAYIALTFQKYGHSSGRTYQESVMRTSWNASSISSDWWFNIVASLKFWQWPNMSWRFPEGDGVYLSLLAGAVFIAGGLAVLRLRPESARFTAPAQTVAGWFALLTAGSVFLTLSFPVYLILNTARSLWRTQFLSGIGAALFLTALFGLASHVLHRSTVRVVAFLALTAVVIYFGSLTAIQRGADFRRGWELHRSAMLQVLRIAPNVEPNTVLVLTNVPKSADPFGDSLWFDMAVRLAYPYLDVSGVYFFADGTPAPGNTIKLEGDVWKWKGIGRKPELGDGSIENTVIINYEPDGEGYLVTEAPPALCGAGCASSRYHPATLIRPRISPLAIQRYRVPTGF